jgi:hypothetical protein
MEGRAEAIVGAESFVNPRLGEWDASQVLLRLLRNDGAGQDLRGLWSLLGPGTPSAVLRQEVQGAIAMRCPTDRFAAGSELGCMPGDAAEFALEIGSSYDAPA